MSKPAILQEMLRAAMRDNPAASEKEIHDLCLTQASSSPPIQLALFEYWFGNSYRDFTVEVFGENSRAVMRQVTDRDVGTREREVKRVKDSMMSHLMDHVLSDGTMLRFATFGQCAKEGGWLLDISKRGKANEVVGKKLTEVDLRNMLQRNSQKRAA